MTRPAPVPAFYPLAIVAFSGATDIRWLRVLRRGFRHVFVALNDGTHWITYDPLSHRTEVAIQPVGAAFDLASYYRRKGLRVIELTPPPVVPRPAPIALCTCVEGAKRVLGIHHPLVLTPWQLYRHLSRHGPERVISHPMHRIKLYMIRFFSLIKNGVLSICRKVADLWRSTCLWVSRQWDRLMNNLRTFFS